MTPALSPSPRITTGERAFALADINREWVIVARDFRHNELVTWYYLLPEHEMSALRLAIAAGDVATVTRREEDGSRVLLAKRTAPRERINAA